MGEGISLEGKWIRCIDSPWFIDSIKDHWYQIVMRGKKVGVINSDNVLLNWGQDFNPNIYDFSDIRDECPVVYGKKNFVWSVYGHPQTKSLSEELSEKCDTPGDGKVAKGEIGTLSESPEQILRGVNKVRNAVALKEVARVVEGTVENDAMETRDKPIWEDELQEAPEDIFAINRMFCR